MPPRSPMGGVKTHVEDNHTHDVRYVLRNLWKYLYRYRFGMFAVLALSLLSNVLALLGPRLSGAAIDAITGGEHVNFPSVYRYALLMLAFYAVSAGLSFLISVYMVRLSQKIVSAMRCDAFQSISRLPVGFTDRHAIGDILSVISYDIDTLSTSLAHDVVQILSSVVTVVGSLYMMLTISPLLILVFAVTIPLSVFITRFITSRTRPLFRARSRKLGELNGFVEEMLSGLKTAKAYNREDYTIDRFDKKNEEAVQAYYKSEYYGSTTGPSVSFVNNLSLSLVSVFGALLYLWRYMSLGDVSSFVLYSRKFSGPINEVANIIAELQSALAAGERVFRLIDEPPEMPDAPDAVELENAQGLVEMKNVSFGYEKNRVILHDLSLVAKPGSVTAIVGPTGAGKTTIINLLMRFYDRLSGEILIDGRPIEKYTRKSLRRNFAMVLQDTWLFGGTVYENIAYGNPAATLEDVKRAAERARISYFIEQLPNGYDTVLTENGGNISKGQKQLLTIARAMLLDASMLILDEATSNVDTQTEIRIQDAMLQLMKNKTCFVIAHRLSTIQNADNILVLDHGDIVEQGTHDELMARGGFYKKLYQAQFES
ncbi:MAG: ABC transporter ATP-binding protein [Eubacteriales bacterium]|nr:ABC transporter ATP-binding protein/permease [Clostridiales bacterium]MDY2769934.1 ABC transporter ATP-binding protein [Eubacteriales bacterium]